MLSVYHIYTSIANASVKNKKKTLINTFLAFLNAKLHNEINKYDPHLLSIRSEPSKCLHWLWAWKTKITLCWFKLTWSSCLQIILYPILTSLHSWNKAIKRKEISCQLLNITSEMQITVLAEDTFIWSITNTIIIRSWRSLIWLTGKVFTLLWFNEKYLTWLNKVDDLLGDFHEKAGRLGLTIILAITLAS